MNILNVIKLVRKNISRNSKQLLVASIGIVIGLWAFSLFLSFGLGITNVVEGEIFPWDKIEVIPPATNLEASRSRTPVANSSACDENDFYIDGKPNGTVNHDLALKFHKKRYLDNEVVEMIRHRPEVRTAYPKMKFTFPAVAEGGQDALHLANPLRTEIFADGIEPGTLIQCNEKETAEDMERPREVRQCDVYFPFQFKDYALDSDLDEPICSTSDDCGPGVYCEEDDPAKIWVFPLNKQDVGNMRNRYYKYCYHAIPVLVSTYLLELWNGSVAPAHGYPKISKSTLGTFLGLTFDTYLGLSMFTSKAQTVPSITRKFQLVGISRKAIPLGVTAPLSVAARYNDYFATRDEAGDVLDKERPKAETYSSIVVRVKSKKQITSFLAFVKKLGFTQEDTNAETVGLVILFITGILVFISFVIVIIAAINIANTYFMIISERRREIGIMRAIGANRGDIRSIFLAEAALLGFLDGGLGLGLGWLTATFVDWVIWHVVPEFPFKPETAFHFPLWLVISTVVFGVAFCVFGALFPAYKAAKIEPSEALLPQ
ncbi:FtsX-like permease family protein [Myxococcota bacterium]|nr:FtsX-like permease family protein [Myxococcota bacterium]